MLTTTRIALYAKSVLDSIHYFFIDVHFCPLKAVTFTIKNLVFGSEILTFQDNLLLFDVSFLRPNYKHV